MGILDGIDPEYLVQKINSINSGVASLDGKFPSSQSLGDSLSNPSTTIIGSALLGFDGTYWERVRTDGSGRLLVWLG